MNSANCASFEQRRLVVELMKEAEGYSSLKYSSNKGELTWIQVLKLVNNEPKMTYICLPEKKVSIEKENKFANSAKTIVDYVKEQNSGSSN